MSETTEDEFLGGRLRIRQPLSGYRGGIDPVLLAAAVPAREGETVLELGTGCGVALLCLLTRVPGLEAVGVERSAEMAGLAARNVKLNRMSARIVEADLTELPSDLRATSFDHVMANPPFFDRNLGSVARDPGREHGRGARLPLSDWVDAGVRRLKPAGRLTLIIRAESLPELSSCVDGRLGDVTVLPFSGRVGRPAKLLIFQAKKGTKGSFRLLAPFVLHAGEFHERDGDDFTPAAAAILRGGARLDLAALTGS